MLCVCEFYSVDLYMEYNQTLMECECLQPAHIHKPPIQAIILPFILPISLNYIPLNNLYENRTYFLYTGQFIFVVKHPQKS